MNGFFHKTSAFVVPGEHSFQEEKSEGPLLQPANGVHALFRQSPERPSSRQAPGDLLWLVVWRRDWIRDCAASYRSLEDGEAFFFMFFDRRTFSFYIVVNLSFHLIEHVSLLQEGQS